MDRLSEIRQRTEAAKAQKEKGDSITAACIAWSIVTNDIPYLLSEVGRLTAQLAESRRREQAAAEEESKQEREMGCEYCADHEDLAFGHDSMNRVGSIYIDGNLLVADLYSESMAVAVCFCPMCGKTLKEETHD